MAPTCAGTANTAAKRDGAGNRKDDKYMIEAPGNAYTSMFLGFRDELDEHHKRRDDIGKVSRDVTVLSKKMIFSLQRVRKLGVPIPHSIAEGNAAQVQEIRALLLTIAGSLQGINRYRYRVPGLEEFVEAISFQHYLEHQTLIRPDQCLEALQSQQGEGTVVVGIPFTNAEYVYGLFDLTGELMRFATAVTALQGHLPAGNGGRTILADLQELAGVLQIVPPLSGGKAYARKTQVMIEQVRKVERIGYGLMVRGNERPKGWMPDANEPAGVRGEGGGDGDGDDV